jgi:opacity protein-like surface antigen
MSSRLTSTDYSMKKLIFTLLFSAFVIPVLNGQFTRIGGGAAYGSGYWFQKTKVEEYRSGHFAGFIEGVYKITVPIHVAGSFTFFYPHIEKYTSSKSSVYSMMFDINGHYMFNSLDKFEFYGIAGLDFLLTWHKQEIIVTGAESFTDNDNAFGLNLGAGTVFNMSEKASLFVEAKYTVSKYSQFMVNAGVFVNIEWLGKRDIGDY